MSQINRQPPPAPILHFEDILPHTGWGLYYKFMLGMACASCFTNATAFLSLPLSMPMSVCENMASNDILFGIHTSFAMGRSLGGFWSCCACDICGRKRLMTYSLLAMFVTTFVAAFAYNYYMIIIAAFFLAGGTECNLCVTKIHLAEILPQQKRGFYLALCDIFWTLGYLALSMFAVTMSNPSVIEHRAVDMRLTTWRMILALSGGFSLMLACCSALLEESPRYFMHVDKDYLAVLTLKQFFAINKSSYGNSFDVKESDIKHLVQDYGLSMQQTLAGQIDLAENYLKIVRKSMKLLLSKQFRKSTLLLVLIKVPLLLLTTFNVNVLLAKLLTENPAKTGLELVHLDAIGNTTSCTNMTSGKILYSNFFVLAVNILLGQVLMLWSLDHFGRRPSLVLALLLSGSSFIILNFVENNMTKIIVSSVLILSFNAAITTTSVLNIELFPTALRGSSHGFTSFLGVFLSIFLVRWYHLVVGWFFVSSGSIFLGLFIVSCFLGELKRQPMVE